jgi:hypothetical protein
MNKRVSEMTSRVRLTRPALTSSSRAARLLPFGPPPLIDGENAAAYDELLTRVSGAVKPADIIEDIWVREFVDLAWEVLRLRRLKAALMNSKVRSQMTELLNRVLEEGAEELALKWAQQKPDAVKQVDHLLASGGMTLDMIIVEDLPKYFHNMHRIDNMLAVAEARRNAALRELDRRRAFLAQGLRRAAEQIETTEYQALDAQPVDGTKAA